jgi:hypothetical protein
MRLVSQVVKKGFRMLWTMFRLAWLQACRNEVRRDVAQPQQRFATDSTIFLDFSFYQAE